LAQQSDIGDGDGDGDGDGASALPDFACG